MDGSPDRRFRHNQPVAPAPSPTMAATAPRPCEASENNDAAQTMTTAPTPASVPAVSNPMVASLSMSTSSSLAASATSTSSRAMARFVTDVSMPDGTKMLPGARFVKTWRIRNDGATGFPAGSRLCNVGGDLMDGPVDGVSVAEVAPTEEADISVTLTAPQHEGRYVGYWRMKTPAGANFGHRLWVDINVTSINSLSLSECAMVTANTAPVADSWTVVQNGDSHVAGASDAQAAILQQEGCATPDELDAADASALEAAIAASAAEGIETIISDPEHDQANLATALATSGVEERKDDTPAVQSEEVGDTATQTANDADVDALVAAFEAVGADGCESNDTAAHTAPPAASTPAGDDALASAPPLSESIQGLLNAAGVNTDASGSGSQVAADAWRWEQQLIQLAEMGFYDVDANIRVLEKHMGHGKTGNMSHVIAELLA